MSIKTNQFATAEMLIQENILLSGLQQTTEENWVLITDIDEAMKYASSQNLAQPLQDWLDMREKQAARIPYIKGLYIQWEQTTGNKLYEYMQALKIDDLLCNDFDGDLYNICSADLSLPNDAFFTMLKTAYSKGVWPCGWKGEYPAGQLLVFNPGVK